MGISLIHSYRDDLRDVIAMEFFDTPPYSFKALLPACDDEERFGLIPDFSLPPIDRANMGDDVYAGRQAFLYQCLGDSAPLLLGSSGDKYEQKSLQGFPPKKREYKPTII